MCKRPFGMLRMRVVEFLADAYKELSMHEIFAENDVYNLLLFYLDHYPYHNILHQRVTDVVVSALDRAQEPVINHFLYQTSLIKKILDTSREGGMHTFLSTGQTLNRGFIVFMRKIANKLADLQKSNEEVASFLDSIPEWADYCQNDLQQANARDNNPLVNDPRARDNKAGSDDYFDLIYKLKDISSVGFLSGTGGGGRKNSGQKEKLSNILSGENDRQDNDNDRYRQSDEDEDGVKIDCDDPEEMFNQVMNNNKARNPINRVAGGY